MHAAIVGAGALGRVYGARLSVRARVGVTFVVRPAKVATGGPIVIERVDDRDDHVVLAAPEYAAEVPAHADVVIVCVRAEQLDRNLADLLERGPDVPAVMMTPMMPADYARMREYLGDRVIAAMPSVVAYVRPDDVVRCWLPRMAKTTIDETKNAPLVLPELVKAFERAGIRAAMEMGVHETNPATTVTFVPLTMALDVGGGVDGLLRDRALTKLALHAAREGAELAKRIGAIAPWAGLLTSFLGPTTLGIAVGMAKRHSPEGIAYVDEHFGRKLHAQNVAMASAMVALAEEKDSPREALIDLRDRLVAQGGA